MNISTWLNENGLGEFAEVFEKQAITPEMLSSLTDADLLAMGLDKLGDRKRILGATSVPKGTSAEPQQPVVVAPSPPIPSPSTPLWPLWLIFGFVVLVIATLSGVFSNNGKSPTTARDSSRDAANEAAQVFDCLNTSLFSGSCIDDGGKQYRCAAQFGYDANRCYHAASSQAWQRGAGKFYDMFHITCQTCRLDF